MLLDQMPAIRLLVHRLSGGVPLQRSDIEALRGLPQRSRSFAKGELIIEQGEKCESIWLTSEGWAFRQRSLSDGRRQIVAIMLPGELSEHGPQMPFGSPDAVVAATPVVAYAISRSSLMDLLQTHPRILQAMYFEELRRHAVSREWQLLLGQRHAKERLAYLIYETYSRLRAMGTIETGRIFSFPVTQDDLADIVGMSAVHLNRTLQVLRSRGVVHWHGSEVEIPDPAALATIAEFHSDFDVNES